MVDGPVSISKAHYKSDDEGASRGEVAWMECCLLKAECDCGLRFICGQFWDSGVSVERSSAESLASARAMHVWALF